MRVEEEILMVAAELKTVEDRRRVLRDRFQVLLDAVRKGASPPGASLGKKGQHLLGTPSKVLQYVDRNPDRTFAAMEIAEELGGDVTLMAVRSSLSRLCRDQLIKRVGQGKYQSRAGVFENLDAEDQPEDQLEEEAPPADDDIPF